MSDPREALAVLRTRPGSVADICSRFDVDLLVAFGSAIAPPGSERPRDLDLAARRLHGRLDLLSLMDALTSLTRCDCLDLVDLARADPLAGARALEQGEPLYEASPGTFVRAQLAAMMLRMDTEWLRQANVRALAETP